MALYEHVFIARQDISAQQVEELTGTIGTWIDEKGGKVVKNEYWGLRTLAYEIKKNRKGHYTLMNIDAPHEAIDELERRIGLNEDIIRHMTLRVEEHEEGPSIQMRQKEERRDKERERRDRDRDDDAPAAEAATEDAPEAVAEPEAEAPEAATEEDKS